MRYSSPNPKKPKKIIEFRQALFWDVDPKTIDPEKHARYIIERILEFGKDEEVSWIFRYYPSPFIKQVMEQARGVLHEKSKNLWTLLLN